jgi:transcription antitermination factor NusA-like protein
LPLKLPICTFDAKTGILCAKCESKLKSGQISQADVQVSNALVKLAEKIPEINRVRLLRSVEVGGNYVIEFEPSDVIALRANPEIAAKLEQQLKGRIWIVGATNSERRFLEDLFYPTRILTVNTVWLPDGSKLTKAIVAGRRGDRVLAEVDKLKRVVKEMKGIEMMVESERDDSFRR